MERERGAAAAEPGGASVDRHACGRGRRPLALVTLVGAVALVAASCSSGPSTRSSSPPTTSGKHIAPSDRGPSTQRRRLRPSARVTPATATHPAPCAAERARRHDRRARRHADRRGGERSGAHRPDRGGAGVHPGRLLHRRERPTQALLQQAPGQLDRAGGRPGLLPGGPRAMTLQEPAGPHHLRRDVHRRHRAAIRPGRPSLAGTAAFTVQGGSNVTLENMKINGKNPGGYHAAIGLRRRRRRGGDQGRRHQGRHHHEALTATASRCPRCEAAATTSRARS